MADNAMQNEKDERQKQRQACVQYVRKLHYEFYKAGAIKGFKEVDKFKKKLESLLESDEGGVWVAGQCIITQMQIERHDKAHCKFRLDPAIYQQYIEIVAKRGEELKKCDAETYEEDLAAVQILTDALAACRKGEDADAG